MARCCTRPYTSPQPFRAVPRVAAAGGFLVRGPPMARTMKADLEPRKVTEPGKSLATFPNPSPGRDHEIRFELPEFTCLCPTTGQPDFATIPIVLVPDPTSVQLKTLKPYLCNNPN